MHRRIKIILLVFCMHFYHIIYAATTTITGSVTLENKDYDKLKITGDAILKDIRVKQLTILGNLTAESLSSEKVQVNGIAYINKSDIEELNVGGKLELFHSVVSSVMTIGPATIKDVKAENVVIYESFTKPVYAARIDNIIVQSKEPLKIVIGDACYINNIIFEKEPGTVYVMKDRSYVGNIVGGTLKR